MLLRWLFPAEWRQHIQDSRQQWMLSCQDPMQIQLNTLQLIWGFLFTGLTLLPDKLIEILQRIDPSFLHKNYLEVYQESLERIEVEFQENHFKTSYRKQQILLGISLLSYISFGILDYWCLPDSYPISWGIRVFVSLCFCLCIILSFNQEFYRLNHQYILCCMSSIAGLGIILMVVIAKPTDLAFVTYYAGLVTIFFYIYSFSIIRFPFAMISGTGMVLGYEITAIFWQNLLNSSPENLIIFINNNFFFLTCTVVGAIACNYVERSMRLQFLIQYAITHKLLELYRFHEHTHPSPQDLLLKIQQLSSSPAKFQDFILEAIVRDTSISDSKRMLGDS